MRLPAPVKVTGTSQLTNVAAMLRTLRVSLVLLVVVSASATPSTREAAPTVELDHGTFTGVYNATTGTKNFLGIPFAQPP